MSDTTPPGQGSSERGRAVERLMAAVSQQRGLVEEHEAAKDDVTTDASLRTANEHVAARKRWLKAVDDHDF